MHQAEPARARLDKVLAEADELIVEVGRLLVRISHLRSEAALLLEEIEEASKGT